jgi:hypothetical protein
VRTQLISDWYTYIALHGGKRKNDSHSSISDINKVYHDFQ